MKLKELNNNIELASYINLVEKYQQEYDILVETGKLDESLLEEGIVAWMQEKAEIGSFLKKVIQDPNLLNTTSVMINKATFNKYLKPFNQKIQTFLKKIETFITDFTDNPTVLNILDKIKTGIQKLKNMMVTAYKYVTNLSGLKKLAGVIGVSALLAKLFDKTELFFKFIENFNIDDLKNKALDVLKQFESFNSLFDLVYQLKDRLFKAVETVGVDVAGLGVVVSVVSNIKSALAYIYSLLKAAKDKLGSLVVGGGNNAVPEPA